MKRMEMENERKLLGRYGGEGPPLHLECDKSPQSGLQIKKAAKGSLFDLERMMGIEPTYPAWEAGVLPMNYIRV